MQRLENDNPDYPPVLKQRLGDAAPKCLHLHGNAGILLTRKVGLFCSARCPGNRILQTHEHVQALRDGSVTVISGFHSPIEKECLRILLRGQQPIIVCPARTLEGMKFPPVWERAFDTGRMLLISPFPASQRRASIATAHRRNEFVAAMSDKVFIAHISPGGQMERIAKQIKAWRIPLSTGE